MPKIRDEHLDELKALIAEKPDRSLEELALCWNQQHDSDVHRSSIHRALNRAGITRKKTFRAIERSRADVIEKERVFLEKISRISPEKLYCYDEASSHLGMTRSHPRSARGQRAVCTKAKVDRENITMAGLLGPDGIEALYPYAGSFDGERYLSYLENHLLPCLTPGDAVIMDNLRMHHIPAAKKMFQDAEIELIFLPPYSQEYNPIEEAWSLIKSVLKKMRQKNIPQYIDAISMR